MSRIPDDVGDVFLNNERSGPSPIRRGYTHPDTGLYYDRDGYGLAMAEEMVRVAPDKVVSRNVCWVLLEKEESEPVLEIPIDPESRANDEDVVGDVLDERRPGPVRNACLHEPTQIKYNSSTIEVKEKDDYWSYVNTVADEQVATIDFDDQED